MQEDTLFLTGHFLADTQLEHDQTQRNYDNCLQVHLPIAGSSFTFTFTCYLYVLSFKSISKVDLFGTLLACGVLIMCTVLGLTPLALVLLYSANLLFLLPRSPLGREPLYLLQREGVGVVGGVVRTGNPWSISVSLEKRTQLR